ncbi:hypothetical protein PsYK624_158340 [Phanerochaete sordida]|uniref:Uncharacterized protein n=1 Tax=Phanerochaete sordida TaxID=48140 RepID=A0A9P3LMP5_9APHY|nr:hypothetical protein PsYK624_158340 [Phanerochaete sordida]
MPTNNASMLLLLNHTKVVFLHPDDTGLSAPCSVQVDVRAQDQQCSTDIQRIWDARKIDISSVILKLVIAHLQQGLPQRFVVEDEELTIYASRSTWKYGMSRFVLTWGDERIAPCQDKWKFALAMRGSGRV